jgi:DNA polymerase zeta
MRSSELVKFSVKGLQEPGKDHILEFYLPHPPTFKEVEATMCEHGVPDVIYQEAFYSNEDDVPARAREYAGREFKLESDTLPFLPEFDPTGTSLATFSRKIPVLVDSRAEQIRDNQRRKRCTIADWIIADTPPPKADVLAWLEEERRSSMDQGGRSKVTPREMFSQIDGPTPKIQYGFQFSQRQQSTSTREEHLRRIPNKTLCRVYSGASRATTTIWNSMASRTACISASWR